MAVLTTAVLDRAVSRLSPATEVAGLTRSRRYRYVRLVRRSITDVIVDVDADGQEDWAERAPDEMQWYTFVPSQAERAMLERWHKAGKPPMRGPFLVGAP